MRSDTADLKNGAQDMYAGLGSSAAFIREFTLNADGSPAYSWAHLDMAAMSLTKEVRGYQPKGGMGFGVRTLVNLVT
jgi:leucyl aminopeptidase